MRKLLFTLLVAICTNNSFAYYQAQQGRWISRDSGQDQQLSTQSNLKKNEYVFLGNSPIGNLFSPAPLQLNRTSQCSSFTPPMEPGWFTGPWYKSQNTIICDGSGNLIVHEATKYPYGVQDCTRKHEQIHIKDWKRRYGSKLCKGRKKGDLPHYDLPGWQFWKPAYKDFLKKSECNAWKVGLKCRKKALKDCCKDKNPSACKKFVEPKVKQAESMVKKYCN